MPRSIEDKVRSSLVFVRFMQTYLPLPLAGRMLKQSMRRVSLDPSIKRKSVSADGVPCEWLIPQENLSDRVLLYLHGGGFVYGLTPQHLQLSAYLGQKIGARVLMVDYRLAPNYPFPAALDDCVKAYKWLNNNGFSARNIVIAGDSAGGNFAITSMIKLRDEGIPLPAAAACLSPVADLSKKPASDHDIKDPLLPKKAMKLYTEAYLQGNDPRNPLISPVFGDLTGFPPLLVHAGEDEVLCNDAVRLVEQAKNCGVDAHLEIYSRMWHVWQIFFELPQAKQSLDEIGQFLRLHLDV
jgi:monoterpene epsilon-lactone hydrolase